MPGDPYSPPCVLADTEPVLTNATGVTDTEVLISYKVPEQVDGAEFARTVNALASYVSKSYQLHGRRLRMVERSSDPAFADITADVETDAINDLADRGIMALGDLDLSAAELVSHRPFIWSTGTDCTRRFDAATALATSVASGPVVVLASTDQADRGCLDDASERATPDIPVQTMGLNEGDDLAAVLSSKPSVVVVGDDHVAKMLTEVAPGAGVAPIWVAADGSLVHDIVARSLGPSWQPALAVTIYQPPTPFTVGIGYEVYKTEADGEPVVMVDALYKRLSMLGIGIQLAGRNLTPASFEAGLRRYPSRLGQYGTWDFTAGYSAVADVVKLNWHPDEASLVDGQPGAWTWEQGVRYRPDGFGT